MKIKLSPRQLEVLFELKRGKYIRGIDGRMDNEFLDVMLISELLIKGLIELFTLKNNIFYRISDKGRAYLDEIPNHSLSA